MISIPPGVGSWAYVEPTGITQVLHSVDDFLAVVVWGHGGRAAFESPTFGLHLEVGFVEMVIKPSPRENKKKQSLPTPGPGHKCSSSRQMGVDVNEAPSRISRMEMESF